MTETELIKELDVAVKQLNMWWKSVVKPDSLPSRLEGKIRFLKAYLKAKKLLQDDKEVARIAKRLKEEYYGFGYFRSKL